MASSIFANSGSGVQACCSSDLSSDSKAEIHKLLSDAIDEGSVDKVRLLLAKGIDVNQPDDKGYYLITEACAKDNVEVVRLLLDAGADVNQPDHAGYTPLHTACMCEKVDVARLLIERGAEVDRQVTQSDSTPLTLSINNVDLVRLLVTAGANLHYYTTPPLYRACRGGYIEVARLLIEAGADVNQGNMYSNKPLHRVCERADQAFAQLLVDNGADFDAMRQWRINVHRPETPQDVAARVGFDLSFLSQKDKLA